MSTLPQPAPNRGILHEEEFLMRPKYTRPEVQRAECKAKPDYWYIRPRRPDGTQPRIKLGICKELGKRAAEKLRDKICRDINREPVELQSRIPLSDFIATYRETHMVTLGPATQRGYSSIIGKHILPGLGAIRLCDFARSGRAEVQRWVAAIDGSKALRTRCLNVLSSIFEHADKCGVYNGRNPARGVKPGQPTKPRRRLRSYTPAEVRRIIQAAPEPLRTQIEVALFAGLRIGEIRALTPAAILDTELDIFQHLDQWKPTLLDSAKDGEDRKVPCPAFLLEKLRAQAAGKDDAELLWDTTYHRLRYALDKLLTGLELRSKGNCFHSLRSTYATLRDALGGAGLQAAMGHSTAAMTQRYVRPGAEMERLQVEAMVAAVYGEAQGGVQ